MLEAAHSQACVFLAITSMKGWRIIFLGPTPAVETTGPADLVKRRSPSPCLPHPYQPCRSGLRRDSLHVGTAVHTSLITDKDARPSFVSMPFAVANKIAMLAFQTYPYYLSILKRLLPPVSAFALRLIMPRRFRTHWSSVGFDMQDYHHHSHRMLSYQLLVQVKNKHGLLGHGASLAVCQMPAACQNPPVFCVLCLTLVGLACDLCGAFTVESRAFLQIRFQRSGEAN